MPEQGSYVRKYTITGREGGVGVIKARRIPPFLEDLPTGFLVFMLRYVEAVLELSFFSPSFVTSLLGPVMSLRPVLGVRILFAAR